MPYLLKFNELVSLDNKLSSILATTEDEWLTDEEAMNILQIDEEQLRNRIQSRKIGYSRIGTKKYFKKSELKNS